MTKDEAWSLANHWVEAWNAHDLDLIMTFRLEDVLWGISSIVLYYTNQNGTRTGEFMELSANGKVVRVVANYNS